MQSVPLLHMIGNAHLDPVWLWRWSEGCAEAIGTCWAAVDLLESEPGFIFTRGEVRVYRWIEDYDPALFERIREYVAAGRWVIVNGWWIQPDCNLPSGEAFIRQALYGKAYVRDRFGVEVRLGYNVDSFGHAGTLPMLLRHTGYDDYIFMRPQAHEMTLPAPLFDWVAPDGSTVTTHRLLLGYNDWPPLAEKLATIEALAAQHGYPLMGFYGVGNHGGGPTRAELAAIAEAQRAGHNLRLSDPVQYVRDVASAPRPAVHGDLQYHAIGCYAVVAALKRLNRRAEAALSQAEAASALASWSTATPYPHDRLRALWETLLFNQFHDILGGTSLHSATQDALQALGGVVQSAEELSNGALRHLAATITPAAPSSDAVFIVFNLGGDDLHLPLEYEPWVDHKQQTLPQRLVDDADRAVAYQSLPPEGHIAGLRLRRLLWTVEVPPFGYRVYRLISGEPAPYPSTLQVGPTTLESATWHLEIDPDSGGIAHLLDKRTGQAVVGAVAHQAIAVDDPSDTWAHGLDRFALSGRVAICERIDIVEEGPLRAGLRVRTRVGASSVTSTYLLYDDPTLPIEIRVQIVWNEPHTLLRLRYPVALNTPTFRYEVPAGSLERPANGREWPGQRWVLVSGTGYGVALATDAVYSYAAADEALYLTVLRSPAYAHHDPYVLSPSDDYQYTDLGEHTLTLRLLAGPTVGPRAAYSLADALLCPPIATPHVSRGGTRPWQGSLLRVQSASSTVATLKASEDGEALILRLLETEGQPDSATLSPGGERQPLSPFGIVTLRGERDGSWIPVDGLEQPLVGQDSGTR